MCLCVGQNDTGLDREGKPAVRARPSRLELSAVVVFTPALWLMPGILGQTFAAEGNYLISCRCRNGCDKV